MNSTLVGKKIRLIWEYEVDIDTTSITYHNTAVLFKTSGGVSVYTSGCSGLFKSSAQTIDYPDIPTSGIIDTNWALIDATVGRFDIKMQMLLTGKIRLGRMNLLIKDA